MEGVAGQRPSDDEGVLDPVGGEVEEVDEEDDEDEEPGGGEPSADHGDGDDAEGSDDGERGEGGAGQGAGPVENASDGARDLDDRLEMGNDELEGESEADGDADDDEEGGVDPAYEEEAGDDEEDNEEPDADEGGSGHEEDPDDDDEDDEDDEKIVPRRRATAPRVKADIPEDLLRRSSRARPQKSYVSDEVEDDDADDAAEGEDSEAEVPSSGEEDYDEDEVSDASEELRGKRPRAAGAAGAAVGSKRPPRPRPAVQSSEDGESDADSSSDAEWGVGSKGKGKRRRKTKRNKTAILMSAAVRLSDRTGNEINYSEDVEDSEEEELLARERAKIVLPVDIAEEDGVSAVERVIDHRAVGETDLVGIKEHYTNFVRDDAEFWIKWERRSYRRATWKTLDELKTMDPPLKGFGKLTNYCKRVEETKSFLLSPMSVPEDLDQLMMQRETVLGAVQENCRAERVVSQRISTENEPEYLVKWENAGYSDCTWENYKDLTAEQSLIDAYLTREQNAIPSGKTLNSFRELGPARKPFKRITEQPKWLYGGPEGRCLRDYQMEGLNFLAFSWCNDRNVILADEMGLGKTLQTISLIGWCKHVKNVGHPFLVVVPLSTIAAWQREFARWLPDLNVVCYQGDSMSRDIIRRNEFFAANGKTVKFNVLLTTPELILADEAELRQFRFSLLAIDEAHRLKNETSSLHLSLREFKTANRLLITGTPLQNSVRELWALLHFLQPEEFPDAESFEDKFSFTALRNPDNIAQLHSTLRPYILRRQKGDVEKSLPKKSYAVLRVGMTPSQAQMYRWILSKNFSALNKVRGAGTTQTGLLNIVMELKKCCNHPYLFDGNEDPNTPDQLQALIRAAGKMVLLDKLLLRLREKGHRVLIFSQMVRMLDILQDYCKMRGFQWQRLDGSMPNAARQRAVDHYNAPNSLDFIFLLSTRAGGLGINLATADTVIIFDSDWNPQNDLQAESRAHRIGQTKDVKVFRFLTKDTVEEDILERAKRKRVLEHLIIHGVEGGENANNANKVTFKKDELSAILRFGAEQLFKTTEGGEGTDKADEQPRNEQSLANEVGNTVMAGPGAGTAMELDDIDAILNRAPAEDENEEVAPSVGDSLLNAFKWADFAPQIDEAEEEERRKEQEAAATAARKLEEMENRKKELLEKVQASKALDKEILNKEGDNEFWNRVIPEEMKEATVANELVLGTRKRKQVKSYDVDGEQEKVVTKRRRSSAARVEENGSGPSRKVVRALIAALMKFGEPDRIKAILKEADVEGSIDPDDASKLLREGLEAATKAVVDAEKGEGQERGDNHEQLGPEETTEEGSHAKKKSDIVVEIGGENFSASRLATRCRELSTLASRIREYQTDTLYRVSNQTQIKPANYEIRWTPMHDSMVLVGIHRHGFGNWGQIKNDKDLQLEYKISIPENPAWIVAGAPEPAALNRRATTLIKAVEKEVARAAASKHKKSSKKTKKTAGNDLSKAKNSSKKSASPKTKASSSISKSKSGKAKGSRISHSKNSKTAKSTKSKSKFSAAAIMKDEHETIMALRSLGDKDLKRDVRLRITKECLLALGAKVDNVAGNDEGMRRKLWKYVHDAGSCLMDADRLESLYGKLKGQLHAKETKD